jgi:SAM-dependent methyltransferase
MTASAEHRRDRDRIGFIEPEVLKACPICGSGRLRGWRLGWDRSHLISRQRFVFSRCGECGVMFESARPPEHIIERFYPHTYYDPRDAPQSSPDARRLGKRGPLAPRIHGRLGELNDWIDRLLPDRLPARLREAYQPRQGRTFLDYGCGGSTYLDWARTHGWERTIGVDAFPLVVDDVRSSGHEAYRARPEELERIDDQSVTLVRMNHVVEHLYEPRTVLQVLWRKLERGGVFHAATPNPAGWASSLMRSRWLGLDCPRHVILYPPAVLGRVASEVGFSRVELLHEVLTKDFARSLGYVLHDLRLLPHEGILGMADRPMLAAVLHTPARLAAHRGASDRFHCFAFK